MAEIVSWAGREFSHEDNVLNLAEFTSFLGRFIDMSAPAC